MAGDGGGWWGVDDCKTRRLIQVSIAMIKNKYIVKQAKWIDNFVKKISLIKQQLNVYNSLTLGLRYSTDIISFNIQNSTDNITKSLSHLLSHRTTIK